MPVSECNAYVNWMLKSDFPEDTKKHLRKIRQGINTSDFLDEILPIKEAKKVKPLSNILTIKK